jgi:hypothetical protein
VLDDPLEIFQNVRSVVDEMGNPELGAVNGLLRALAAKADVGLRNVGLFEKPVGPQPLLCALLDPGTAFRHDPDLPLKGSCESGQGRNDTCHGRGLHGFVETAAEKGRVIAAGMRSAVVDDSSKVDAQNGPSFHTEILHPAVLAENYQ